MKQAATEATTAMSVAELEQMARRIRASCIQMAQDGKEGHLSSSLAYVDALTALYFGWLRLDPARPDDPERDRFILSKGHGCTALYATLAARGFLPRRILKEYNQEFGPLPNHSCRHALPLLEMSAGSLGQGLGVATGIAYGLRLRGSTARVAVVLGDGECNEGSVWEAAMFAAAQHLGNVLAVVDYNGIQAVGRSDEIMGHTALEEKFRSFGWNAWNVDGTRMADLLAVLAQVPVVNGQPSVIVARTRMGVSFMENDVVWHYRKPSEEEVRRALAELQARPLQGDE
jgi:transketolase